MAKGGLRSSILMVREPRSRRGTVSEVMARSGFLGRFRHWFG